MFNSLRNYLVSQIEYLGDGCLSGEIGTLIILLILIITFVTTTQKSPTTTTKIRTIKRNFKKKEI